MSRTQTEKKNETGAVDAAQRALDGGEGCAGVDPGSALVMEQCDQSPMPHSGCQAMAQAACRTRHR